MLYLQLAKHCSSFLSSKVWGSTFVISPLYMDSIVQLSKSTSIWIAHTCASLIETYCFSLLNTSAWPEIPTLSRVQCSLYTVAKYGLFSGSGTNSFFAQAYSFSYTRHNILVQQLIQLYMLDLVQLTSSPLFKQYTTVSKNVYTLLRSPHTDKKARVQFSRLLRKSVLGGLPSSLLLLLNPILYSADSSSLRLKKTIFIRD